MSGARVGKRSADRAPAQEALEFAPLIRLLPKFCVPALLGSLVTSVYNIMDELFIGNTVGILGNAATNVVYPAVTLLTSLSMMCGVGTSAVMNLALGEGDRVRARRGARAGLFLMVGGGLLLSVLMLAFTEPFLDLFGCTDAVLPYALPYARITALGFVLSVLGTGGPFLIRADGSPNYALASTVSGSIVDIVLDVVFIFGFGWGIAGAAWSTVIGQAVSAAMVLWYLPRFRSFSLIGRDGSDAGGSDGAGAGLAATLALVGAIAALGAGPMFNFLTQALTQVFLNGALRTWGALSLYGSESALAVAGVASKVNTIAVAVVTGLANGMQPIVSYNYGRRNYRRVVQTGRAVIGAVVAVSFLIFLAYQIFPRQITAFFGGGDELYFQFAEQYFRTFYLLVFLNGLLSSVGGFFSAQGKPWQSIALSATRQVLLLPPLLAILPRFWGLTGVLWCGPIADLVMAVLAATLLFRRMRYLQHAE